MSPSSRGGAATQSLLVYSASILSTVTPVPKGVDVTQVDVSWKMQVKNVPGFVQGIVKGQISKATEDALKRFRTEAVRPGPAKAG